MIDRNLLRAKIVERGYTQERLAKEMGISKNTLSKKINGYSSFTVSEVILICDILGIDTDAEKCQIFLNKISQN